MLQSWDGYDHYDDQTDFLARSGFLQYQKVGSGPAYSFITGRDGLGKALQISQGTTGYTDFVFGQRVSSAYIGMACKFVNNSNGAIFGFTDSLSGDIQVTVIFDYTNYSIKIYRGGVIGVGPSYSGGTLLYASANNVWSGQVYNFIEIWPIIASGTSGSVNVWIKKKLVASISGVDTQESTNSTWDIMDIAGTMSFSTALIDIDDFYYGDTTTPAGAYPFVAPIGDSHTDTLFAVGNNAVQWTPLANTNYQEINEVVMDSDTSYNFSSTVGQEDTFNYNALDPGIAYIFGIQLTGAYRKDNSGVREVKQTIISSATQVYGPNYPLSDSDYNYFTDAWTLDPATSALWTVGAVNAIMAGYNVAV